MIDCKGSITSSRVAITNPPCIPCAQFLAADADASATAALVKEEQRARASVPQPQAQKAAGGAVPTSKAGDPSSVAKDSQVAPAPQPAAWNVTTGGPVSPAQLALKPFQEPQSYTRRISTWQAVGLVHGFCGSILREHSAGASATVLQLDPMVLGAAA